MQILLLEYRAILGAEPEHSFILRLDYPRKDRNYQRVLWTPYLKVQQSNETKSIDPLPSLPANLPAMLDDGTLFHEHDAAKSAEYYLETNQLRNNACLVLANESTQTDASWDLFYYLPYGFAHRDKVCYRLIERAFLNPNLLPLRFTYSTTDSSECTSCHRTAPSLYTPTVLA